MTFTILASKSHRRRIGARGFAAKVLSHAPYAYWPLDEAAGSVVHCLVDPANNGTYTGVTLANDATGPFGTAAPFFDGANDYAIANSAALIAAFDGTEGSMMVWAKVANAGVWTDTVSRETLYLVTDGNNFIQSRKDGGANLQRNRYRAGGIVSAANTACSNTAWVQWVLTWSLSADEMKAFINGAQWGATQTGLGTWAGALGAVYIGASSAAPGNVYHGWLAHAALWDRALPAAAILDLANP